jgi:hypothetical protein
MVMSLYCDNFLDDGKAILVRSRKPDNHWFGDSANERPSIMSKITREFLKTLSLRELRRIAQAISELICEIDSEPRREIDIAAEHTGDPDMIYQALPLNERRRGRWKQQELIYCSKERCPHCPHGEFVFSYRENRRKKTRSVEYLGQPLLPSEVIRGMKAGLLLEKGNE